ncbi:WXG100 family type VII secretion target [Mycobacteroides chelonae]|uniref:WXG100 family type VII secretion target n=1 Tax=Mycobacteroides chelonae TaxID=1774 RepID=UPI0008A8D90A|nr:WXG100 family type VII secretion target [Mycobacteroides chelonae]AYM43532.1 WXG100 family type VII secretion target [[Mycobacterium] chelonae subsp. gwanakae]OHU14884.1 hypothetical protein BKG75_06695 [Mycobacteroides chelonae]
MGTEGSSGEVLQLTPERVYALANQITSATEGFKAQLSQVDEEVRTLLGAGWKGDPGSQFHDAFADWHKGSSDVVDGMTLLASKVYETAASLHRASDRF